jgi:AraC-like DNA-binding protein
MPPSVLSVGSRVLLSACKELGLDGSDWVEKVGLDPRAIDDPDGRLPPERAMALWEEAYRASGDEHLALEVASRLPPGAYRALEYLAHSAPTLGSALEKVSQYFAWIDSSARLPVVEQGPWKGLSLEVDAPPARVPLRAVEFTFGATWSKIRAIVRTPVAPARIEVAGAEPRTLAPFEQFFGCKVHFGCQKNQILFARADWSSPTSTSDPALFEVLDERTRTLTVRAHASPSWSDKVREAIDEPVERPNLARVAKRLGISARTLQRRLQEEGVVFADLADQMRARRARALVSDPGLALVEAAYLLGFSDQSSFTRSFRRWTGLTPAAFRSSTRPQGAEL